MMGNSKTTWPPRNASRCQAINGYGRTCNNMAGHNVCGGQMTGFCGVHMNTSFTVAAVLKLVAQDLRDDNQPDLADAMLKKYGVDPDEREVPLEDEPYHPEYAPPGCLNCHSAMIFDSVGIEGTLYRCTGCPARTRVQRS